MSTQQTGRASWVHGARKSLHACINHGNIPKISKSTVKKNAELADHVQCRIEILVSLNSPVHPSRPGWLWFGLNGYWIALENEGTILLHAD